MADDDLAAGLIAAAEYLESKPYSAKAREHARAIRLASEQLRPTSITCPRCGLISHHPEDPEQVGG